MVAAKKKNQHPKEKNYSTGLRGESESAFTCFEWGALVANRQTSANELDTSKCLGMVMKSHLANHGALAWSSM